MRSWRGQEKVRPSLSSCSTIAPSQSTSAIASSRTIPRSLDTSSRGEPFSPARGFAALEKAQIGFGLKGEGETVYLYAPNRSRVIDAWSFDAQAEGVSFGRFPDGAAMKSGLGAPTPGAANRAPWESPVVINEIMYAPISGDPDDEYVELYNRSGAPVNLASWRFVDGIDFTFPAGTVVPVDGYLVVARNRERLFGCYAQLNRTNTVGDFQGALANSGERLALAMPADGGSGAKRWVVVNEVAWRGGGRWPELAHEGGSSLELVDPRADTRWAANWAASDETAKSAWTMIEAACQTSKWGDTLSGRKLQLQMLGAGECLLSRVEVFKEGDTNLVLNPDFGKGDDEWYWQGNHSASTVEPHGAEGAGPCLHVRATGRGDTGANRIRTYFAASTKRTQVVTIRARARWLAGWPEILLRIPNSAYEASGRLSTPQNPGTPGCVNSRRVTNAGPAISEVTPDPVLPAAGEAVTVRARIGDVDGLGEISLNYRVDPDTNYTVVPLAYRGAGWFSGTIPGQATGAVAAFYLEAADARAPAAVSRFPSDAPRRECVVRFGDPVPLVGSGVYRLWLTDRKVREWNSRERLSNDPLDCAFVYDNARVVYNAGVVGAGSPWTVDHKQSPLTSDDGCVIHCPPDDRCLNATDLTLDYAGLLSSPVEQAAEWLMNEAGIQGGYRRVVRFLINGNLKAIRFSDGALVSGLFEDCLQPNGDVVDQEFQDDSDGDLYKIDDWFEFDDQAVTFGNTDATLNCFTNLVGQKLTSFYRWNWRKRAVRGSANDFSSLFELVDAINPKSKTGFTPDEIAALEALVDLEQWTRVLAAERVVGNHDSYGQWRGKNMYAHKPRQGKWVLWPWDMDLGSLSYPTLTSPAKDRALERVLELPAVRRLLLRAAREIADGPMAPARMGAFLDQHEAALKTNGYPRFSLTAFKEQARQGYARLLAELAPYDAPFALQSSSTLATPTQVENFTLQGLAPLTVYEIRVNGEPAAIQWLTPTKWSVRIALAPGHNAVQITGYDRWGKLLSENPAPVDLIYQPSPAILRCSWKPDAGFTLTWKAAPGMRYRLQTTSEFPSDTWTDVGEPVLAEANTATQTVPPTSDRRRFYRIAIVD